MRIMADCPTTFIPGDYVMPQNYNKDDSKVYVRVKMTDSAYRAIEEYCHYSNTNHFTNGQNPKVQIDGNSGIIRIPTLANEMGVNFGFSLDAVEGSMEAVQQTAEGLNILGSITHRMRLHANEDVFAETRTKMAMSEESERSKCTKVIHSNKSEIGRKVKQPVATLSGQHVTHKHVYKKACPELPAFGATERSNSTRDVKSRKTDLLRSLSKPTNVDTRFDYKIHDSASLKSNGKSSHERESTSNTLPSLPLLKTTANLSSTLTNENVILAVVKKTDKEMKSVTSHHSTGANAKSKASGTKGGKGSTTKCNKQLDITRCKIKERVIQMLAVKPYKKLELYTRLQNKGLRDGERQVISTVLREIALLRDNAYNLRRHIWNMVKEDWPFYSEKELQRMKENKPKDLTPPISSDTASQHSLNSPSPPQVALDSDLNCSNNLKRPDEVYHNPVPSKKQRISHLTTKERVGNHMRATGEQTLVYNRNAVAVDGNKVINGTQITANSIKNESKRAKTSNSRSDQQPAESKSKKSSAPVPDKQPTEIVNVDTKSSSNKPKRKSRKSKISSAPDSDVQSAEIMSVDTKNSSNKLKSKSRKSKKYSAPDSDKQPNEIVNVDTRNGSNKPKSSSRSETVSTDAERKKKSAAPVSDQQPAEKTSSDTTINRKNNTYKFKKSSDSVSDKQPEEGVSADKSSSKNKASNSKGSRDNKTVDIEAEKQQKSSRSEFSTNKETTRKSKCNNNADIPCSSATSKIIESHKHREQQSSQHVEPQKRVQQQYTSLESIAHQFATSNALRAHGHAEQQSFQHMEPQPRIQQQFKPQKPVAQHSIITETDNSEPLSHFDFSSYTPITCVEQRRLYKAEFESDYEEYSQLFQSVKYVRRNFHILINQLKELPPDCPTYQHIQQQIVLEYERLDNVEERQRKQRFDYLQAKLAHITQLVNDYDAMLKAEAVAIEAAVRQHRLFQQQQQMLPIRPIDEPEGGALVRCEWQHPYADHSCTAKQRTRLTNGDRQ
nr:RNA polymerase II elongation factor Ell-like [Bactrocera oleae]